jgi:Flp pilus assembly protein TadG
MALGCHFDSKRGMPSEHGGVAAEFGIIVPILLSLVLGITHFGHVLDMKHLMSDASREGVRYGSRYMTDSSGNPILPKNLNPGITNYTLNAAANGGSGWDLANRLPGNPNPTVSLGGVGATEGTVSNLAGEDLTIMVNATKTWFVLGSLIPGFGSTKTLTVTITMICV